MKYEIDIHLDEDIGLYTVTVKGDDRDFTLECLSEAEVKALTIGEIMKLYAADY